MLYCPIICSFQHVLYYVVLYNVVVCHVLFYDIITPSFSPFLNAVDGNQSSDSSNNSSNDSRDDSSSSSNNIYFTL